MIKQHHHISMYSKDLKTTDYFYTRILGLRRVKASVNQNNPHMYHVFYGDRTGSAGNDLTFFDYSKASEKVEGTNAHTAIGLLVSEVASLDYWQKRLEEKNIQSTREEYIGYDTLLFKDPNNLTLRLFTNTKQELPSDWEPWLKNDVDNEHVILGMGPVEITVRNKDALIQTLQELFNYQLIENQSAYARIRPKADEIYGEIIIIEKAGSIEKDGWGTIHHLAIQIEADQLDDIKAAIIAKGFRPTIYDRYYFNSLYFRDSNGVMFEVVANHAAGFMVDTQDELLGEQLDLPPFLEDQRAEIEQHLMPLDDWMVF